MTLDRNLKTRMIPLLEVPITAAIRYLGGRVVSDVAKKPSSASERVAGLLEADGKALESPHRVAS